jgi:hypothetical protein
VMGAMMPLPLLRVGSRVLDRALARVEGAVCQPGLHGWSVQPSALGCNACLEYTDSAQAAAPFRAARERALARWQRPRQLGSSSRRGPHRGTPRRDPDRFRAKLGEALAACWRAGTLVTGLDLGVDGCRNGARSGSRQARCPQLGQSAMSRKKLNQINDRHAENASREEQRSFPPCASAGSCVFADDFAGHQHSSTSFDAP